MPRSIEESLALIKMAGWRVEEKEYSGLTSRKFFFYRPEWAAFDSRVVSTVVGNSSYSGERYNHLPPGTRMYSTIGDNYRIVSLPYYTTMEELLENLLMAMVEAEEAGEWK